jgi:uncharacterized membrane protein YdjX (TVP38/TMEM64 family)
MQLPRHAVAWVLVAGAAGLVAAAIAWGPAGYRWLSDRERIQETIGEFGALAPLAAIGLAALQVVVAPLPAQTIYVASGYLFGWLGGSLVSLIGVQLGTLAAMWLARRFGRPLVERFVSPQRLADWDLVARRRGPPFFLLFFLLPFLPDDLICFVIGLSRLPLWLMFMISAVGRLPGLLAGCALGAFATEWPPWAWWLGAALGIVLGGAVIHYRYRLQAAAAWLAHRFSSEHDHHDA